MSRVAFIDESQRGDFYALASIALPHRHIGTARKAVRSLAPTKVARRHFTKESEPVRRRMLDVFRDLPGTSVVAVSKGHRSVTACRSELLSHLVTYLLGRGLDRIVFDHVDDAGRRRDLQTLWNTLGRRSRITYDHEVAHTTEPLLWVPDAIAWCAGRPEWRGQLDGWVTTLSG